MHVFVKCHRNLKCHWKYQSHTGAMASLTLQQLCDKTICECISLCNRTTPSVVTSFASHAAYHAFQEQLPVS